ncbi:alpha/beta hydrolase [Aurantibacter sp.]|uniref:alpha/beta hydrolase n=1 Tax=Aurantibacter sp. TaxID=2807103 RepID=UPI0035C846E0
MNSAEKEISYKSTNSYSTLNTLTEATKNVWLVCHGLGYLSRYFLRYFKDLNPTENYIIAAQAPSKYYQGKSFKHVGACWFTKENTTTEIDNVCNYLQAVLESEAIPEDKNIILFGYSQGVSVALRYLAKYKLKCKDIIIHSGGIPKELEPEYFKNLNTKVTLIYGTKDEYLIPERMEYESNRAKELFGANLDIIPFNGTHEVNVTLIKSL